MEVISTRYEARPPANIHSGILVDPENSVATVKEEEWETRKKKEITTTRQIETRVKRQVVLEDGEVVVDSGPLVTTNTTEDIEQQEHTTQERRTNGDDPREAIDWPTGAKVGENGSVVQKELNETIVRSREEIEELLETEDRQQLGNITDEAYLRAIQTNTGDLRTALAESAKQLAVNTGPRVVQHKTRSNKVVDTEKTHEKKQLKADGLIVTETKTTVEHEEIKDDELPADSQMIKDNDSETKIIRESSQKFTKKRDEDIVDYMSGGELISREMRHVSESTEAERHGDWQPATRLPPLNKNSLFTKDTVAAVNFRKDAITKKPLDIEEEDEARKVETSKWLESHFGSESRSSQGSIDMDEPTVHTTGSNTSYINVTMKSVPPPQRDHTPSANYNARNRTSTPKKDSTFVETSSGYFHGISEWSERQQQRTNKSSGGFRSPSPQERQIIEAPSPPQRRKRDQRVMKEEMKREEVKKEEAVKRTNGYKEPSPVNRAPSPVHVVQRTWDSRVKDIKVENDWENRSQSPYRVSTPSAESVSKQQHTTRVHNSSAVVNDKNSPKSQTKYKIGESLKKFVRKLRSASSERKSKSVGSANSISQLTQTDDKGPTYWQYNVIDRNIPLVSEHSEERLRENKSHSTPKYRGNSNSATTTTTRTYKSYSHLDVHKGSESNARRDIRNERIASPVQRYYLGEDPFAGSIYGREKDYKNVKRPGRQRRSGLDSEHGNDSYSLGRLSKSTSRLTSDYEREEFSRNTQTLPRKLHSEVRHETTTQSHNIPQPRFSNYMRQGNSLQQRHNKMREYGSMINISVKNRCASPKMIPVVQDDSPSINNVKPKLDRSRSFNYEAQRNGNNIYSPKTMYRSNTQLNRLDETTPLKSPGILASINRGARDRYTNGSSLKN